MSMGMMYRPIPSQDLQNYINNHDEFISNAMGKPYSSFDIDSYWGVFDYLFRGESFDKIGFSKPTKLSQIIFSHQHYDGFDKMKDEPEWYLTHQQLGESILALKTIDEVYMTILYNFVDMIAKDVYGAQGLSPDYEEIPLILNLIQDLIIFLEEAYKNDSALIISIS